MPDNKRLVEQRLKQFETQKPRALIEQSEESALDAITRGKQLRNKPRKYKGISTRRIQFYISVGLGFVSGVFGYIAFISPVANMQTPETAIQNPDIVNNAFESMTPAEREILERALADFYRTFGILDPGLTIIDSQYKNAEFPQEIYSSPGELQVDMPLIRANAASKGLPMEIYFRLTLLDSISPSLQTPGGVTLPESIDVALPEGYPILGYKGFGVEIDVGAGQAGYLGAPEVAFRAAFAESVDPMYSEVFDNGESIELVNLILAHYGVGIGEALDFNRGHGLDHFLIKLLEERTITEGGAPLSVRDISVFLMVFNEVNNGGSAEEYFQRFVRLTATPNILREP